MTTNLLNNNLPHLPESANTTLLKDAFYQHVQATVQLTKVALALEWTVFTRFTVGVVVATFLSIVYLMFTLRHTRRPLVIWEKLNKPIIKLFRPRLFAFLLGGMNPYTTSIDMTITTLSKGFCTGFMRVIYNCHFSLHATALATFAESVGELALLSSLKDDISDTDLVSLKIDFKKKARGLIAASTEFCLPEQGDQDSENSPSKLKMNVVLKDRTLETVAVAHLIWHIAHHSSHYHKSEQ
ncbi:hypothetical protein BDF20DRAFT_815624 [Mycotypha africana]|uniref:uncharacterized protein n=1 Tax=Mycotypha africana TaxID=64632 RepID=UPI0022FFE2A5|nr:uncharacterized protein BDF20DRAFT_815624 [Mycotypha africana]KAI8987709.1 hypothetical protein BDF20DRAFT_815624 [Mycotypha africana]